MTKQTSGTLQQEMFDTKHHSGNLTHLCDSIEKHIKKYKLTSTESSLSKELEEMCLQHIRDKANSLKKKNRLVGIDEAKEKVKASSVLNAEDILKLPEWVRARINEAFVIGNSGKVVSLDGKKYHLDNPLNELTGGEWTYFLRSVINTRYPATGIEGFAHHIRKIHPTPKPPQLMRDIIKFFTKKDEWVLDYFMGVGGTLLGASLCDRRAIGVDLNQKYIDAYGDATKELDLVRQKTICGDSLEILESGKIKQILGDEKLSLVCIDPPYGDMMSRKKTGEAAKRKESIEATPFTNLAHDLGNTDKATFLDLLKTSVESAIKLLKDGRYVVVFIKDLQPSGKNPNLLHADIINKLIEIKNLNYSGTKIWADESVNLYPYGYPYAFVSNQLHQYILIFRKASKCA